VGAGQHVAAIGSPLIDIDLNVAKEFGDLLDLVDDHLVREPREEGFRVAGGDFPILWIFEVGIAEAFEEFPGKRRFAGLPGAEDGDDRILAQ